MISEREQTQMVARCIILEGHKEIPYVEVIDFYFDCGGSYITVFMCENSQHCANRMDGF